MRMPLLISFFALLAQTANAASLSTVSTCRLDDQSQVVLQAEPAIDGNRFFLQIDGKVEKAFSDMPDTDFVGTIALATCVDHVLVFAISYGPPYLKGVAIRKNPVSHLIERIDFSEKALPRWLYLNASAMQLVIPNIGYEVRGKYLVYQYVVDTGQPTEPVASDSLPGKRGFKVLNVTTNEPRRRHGSGNIVSATRS